MEVGNPDKFGCCLFTIAEFDDTSSNPTVQVKPLKTRKGKKMAEQAYCVKCKAKVEMKDAQKVQMKNGRPAMKGSCSKCGTGVYKILPMK
jgi:hypothetical protein